MSALVKSVSRHTLRQLKFIVPGGLLTWFLDSHHVFWHILNAAYKGDVDTSGWARTTAFAALALGALTISLFLYILLVPIIKGEQPDFRHWRQSGVLSSVIPILTTSIVVGWSLLVFTFGRYAHMGWLEGIVAACGLYALGFGLMGLIPAPKVYRRA